MSKPVVITLYLRPGCHLCEEAHEVIERVRTALAPGITTTLHEVDILSDPALARRYAEEIPVVYIGDRRHAIWRVDEHWLAAAIVKASRRRFLG